VFVRITNDEYELDLVGPFTIDGQTGEQVSHLTIVRASGTMEQAHGMIIARGTATLSGMEAIGGYEGSWETP
jgi:hypothetical protein